MFHDVSQRHFLDEGDIDTASAGEVHQVQYFILVAPLEHDRVDLDSLKALGDGGFDPGQHLVQVTVAGQLPEAAGLQAVQADVDALDAVVAQLPRHPLQLGTIGSEHQLVQRRQLAETLHQGQNVRAYQRFAAGQANFAHPQFGESLRYLEMLFQGENLGFGNEGHFLRHTVHTAKIASIRHRQANIVDPALEAIYQC